MEAVKNWVDLSKRGGPFPLAIVPARPVSGIKPEKTACSIPSSFGLAILTLIIISNFVGCSTGR
jgi:hypothetical protein